MAYLPSAEHRLRSKERPKTETEIPNQIQYTPNAFFSAVDAAQDLASMPERLKTPLTKNLQALGDVFTHLLNEHNKPEQAATSKTKNRF